MDSATQAVLGATVAAAAVPKLGRKGVLFGAICGLLPDLDVLPVYNDGWARLTWHRSYTHSLLVMPLAVPLLGWVGHRWFGRRSSRPGLRRGSTGDRVPADSAAAEQRPTGTGYVAWAHLAFWALVTHSLLDLCTSHGTQLLWPISHARYALDAVAVIDLFYTLPLVVGLVLACGWRSRAREDWFEAATGARSAPRPRGPAQSRARVARAPAVWALAVTTAYLAFGFHENRQAIALAEQCLADEGFHPEEVRAVPTLGNVFVWRVAARDAEGNLRVGYVSTWQPYATQFAHVDAERDPLIAQALASPRGALFAWHAMNMVSAHVERRPDGAAVLLADHRYGLVTRPAEPVFRARAEFDAQGNLVRMVRLRGVRGASLGDELRAVWRLLRGG